jgi:hypothetical protein
MYLKNSLSNIDTLETETKMEIKELKRSIMSGTSLSHQEPFLQKGKAR